MNPAYLWLPSKRLRVWHQRELFISREKRSLITSRSELMFIYLISSPRLRFMSINGDERLRTITHKATRVLHKHSTWMKWMMPEISLSRDLLSFYLLRPPPPKSLFERLVKGLRLMRTYVHHNCLFIAMPSWAKIHKFWSRAASTSYFRAAHKANHNRHRVNDLYLG